VLAQLDADATDYRFPIAVAPGTFRDVHASVRCKMVSGEVDQAAGLVFRYRSASDYYVTRANALENNVRLYTVVAGRRSQIAGYDGPVAPNVWHELAIEARLDKIEVLWDGHTVITHRDATFPDAGQVGVWTKADSVTYFDDLRARALKPE